MDNTNIATNNPDGKMFDAFAQMQGKNDMAEVLKELFDKDKINLITDLTKDEIKLCTRIHLIAEMKNIASWKSGLQLYLKLLLSKDRKSRREVLEAIKGYSTQQSFLQKMNPFNRG